MSLEHHYWYGKCEQAPGMLLRSLPLKRCKVVHFTDKPKWDDHTPTLQALERMLLSQLAAAFGIVISPEESEVPSSPVERIWERMVAVGVVLIEILR